jgi:two-component system, OmpR family, response regulator
MRIVVIEDNHSLAAGIARLLRDAGFTVDVVHDALGASAALRAGSFDIMVLDLNLPDGDGIAILSEYRARGGDAAVIVLTARAALDERVHGLDAGADDYVSKPFEPAELEARVRALCRRRAGPSRPRVCLGPLDFDLGTRLAYLDGVLLDLPRREGNVLETLILRAGRVISKEQIAEAIGGFSDIVSDNAIELYISRLRRRLEPAGIAIRTVRGLGYLIEAPADNVRQAEAPAAG